MGHVRALFRDTSLAILRRVDHDELLRRLDEHMARGNELMTRGNELMGRVEVALEANTSAFNDLSQFLHVQTIAMRDLARETVTELRAQRGALCRILDRLDGRGGEAGA
jgi:hypothetical protein